jgi:hypothetical protein
MDENDIGIGRGASANELDAVIFHSMIVLTERKS